ncbi:efflux RND transporter periplasmic adaptor subunit [Autumnicola edwardsiae]|uniref:Efflux RND transporter periplasmic adaptor subunit n=1 Tax=Autumnicola edwardsiae TaxID=3075594 RepID=A0ABU3CQE2_9FLAO|nr:efflux RND transporter periplasmic adaptor subunit [Zunongwangia sp. F297]MDT0648574.1 efflux RND transporter periplasmic adaptor subunit [Zunongwangia sp. F297]
MKKISVILSLILLLTSCGGEEKSVDELIENGNLAAIKQKRQELNEEQKELREKLDKLNKYVDNQAEKTLPQLVTVQKLNDTLFKHYIQVQGDIETDQNIIIFPEYSGVLTDVYVKEGDRVQKGQLLAKIEDAGLSNQLAQQQTQARLAETTFERRKNLWEQKIGSEIQFLEAQANYEAAVEAANQTQKQLAKTELRAPFAGEIDNIIAEEGQVVNQGQTEVMRLVDLSDMYVRAAIPENYLSSIEKGSKVIVNISAIGEQYKGVIRQVGNYINPDNRKYDVEIAIPNKDRKIKPNLIADVQINNYTNQDAILIPETILQENAEGEAIAFIYEPESDSTGVAKKVKLELGLNYQNHIEVKSGLKDGDVIVIEGSKNIRDGQRIAKTNLE